jgi:3-oxoadipate enol-lactonase
MSDSMSDQPYQTVRLMASLDGPPGAPVLVLGNSLGTTRAVWEGQIPAFRRRFRLLRYEHRGHGGHGPDGDPSGSPAPPGPYSIAALGADVLALLDAHEIDRAAYCGISMGGMIGMWLAANAPHRISALGLCCTSAHFPSVQVWHERATTVRGGGMTAISGPVVARWFTPAFAAREPAVTAAFLADLERTDPAGYAGCCDALAAMDLRSSLGSIRAPTLVIAGAEDPATPPAHGAQVAAAIAGARLSVIRGAAHLAPVSAAGEVTAALLAHLHAAL